MFVGIDVSKRDLVVAIRPGVTTMRLANTPAGIATLVAELTALAPARIVFEASGGYERDASIALIDAGLETWVVNARRVRLFAEGIGVNAKTDPIDADVIARFAEMATFGDVVISTPATRELAALVTRRRQLLAAFVAEQNQASTALAVVADSHATILAALKAECDRLTAEIAAKITVDPVFQAKATVLTSVPGIGPVTAAVLLAELPELGAFNRGRIASLAGVAPFTKQSGKIIFPAHIRGGRDTVRTSLYMATLTAIRHNPVIHAFYHRLLDRRKPKKVAIVASMRKLLTILNTMLRDGTTWDTSRLMA